jgi:hypothetical protein
MYFIPNDIQVTGTDKVHTVVFIYFFQKKIITYIVEETCSLATNAWMQTCLLLAYQETSGMIKCLNLRISNPKHYY